MKKWIIGIDEAGRGPLAGPVAVGVAMVSPDFDWAMIEGVTDSKKLTEKKREVIYLRAQKLKKEGHLNFAVSMVAASVIDRMGIVGAVSLGMHRALEQLSANPARTIVKLDGGLRVSDEFLHQETIIKGDAKEQVIGLASIVAKVTRDRYMVRKSAEPIFAPYDFHIHKGYGTKKHRASIAKNGLTALHRKSYCKNIEVL